VEFALTRRRQIRKSRKIPVIIPDTPKDCPDVAVRPRNHRQHRVRRPRGISTSTKGEVREAVDHALELLDKARPASPEHEAGGKWKVNQWPEEGGAALVPPQRHGPDRRRPRPGLVVGQGALEVRRLGRERFRDAGFRAVPGAIVRRSASSPATSC